MVSALFFLAGFFSALLGVVVLAACAAGDVGR